MFVRDTRYLPLPSTTYLFKSVNNIRYSFISVSITGYSFVFVSITRYFFTIVSITLYSFTSVSISGYSFIFASITLYSFTFVSITGLLHSSEEKLFFEKHDNQISKIQIQPPGEGLPCSNCFMLMNVYNVPLFFSVDPLSLPFLCLCERVHVTLTMTMTRWVDGCTKEFVIDWTSDWSIDWSTDWLIDWL